MGHRRHAKSTQSFFFSYGKGNKNHQLGTGCFVHHRIVPTFKRVEFVTDRMSYSALRGHWYNIIVLNVHARSQEKTDGSKESFMRNYSSFFFIIFLSTM